MELILQTVINAVMQGFFYSLMAIGFTMIFGIMGIINFAHGELYMLGAYVVWLTYAQGIMPFPVAVIAGAGIVAGVGLAMERGLFRPMRGNAFMACMLSIAMLFILQNFAKTTWHIGHMKRIPPYMQGVVEIFGASAPLQRLMIIPVVGGLIGGLLFFLKRVKHGQALRAVAQDPEAASLQGISIDKAGFIAMAIAAGLAGVAGGMMAPIVRVDPYMGHTAVMTALMVTIVGGLGSIGGALLASFIYGFLICFVTIYFDAQVAMIAAALFMFIILIVKPRGLLSHA